MNNTSLLLDFGNTACKAAIAKDGIISHTFVFSLLESEQKVIELVQTYKPSHSILSSVVMHALDIETYLQNHTKFLLLNHTTKLPFINAYETPHTLGIDRLALVAGASVLFPLQNTLVISLGTCITYNFITANNTFRGGAISPGIDMRFKSMHEYTEKLPLVSKNGTYELIGYNTETSLRSGVLNGIYAEILGIIELYEKQHGKINAVLTGGAISYFESKIKNKIFADHNILFNGLQEIIKYNL